MRWYEYKMEADDLHAPEDLKAKLLAMADTLPEEEKNRPMMPAQADNTAVVRLQEPPKKAKLIHFPAKQVGALAACLAVCVVGYGALSTGKLDIGAKSSNMALYSANSSAASTAGGFTTQQAMLDATPEAMTWTGQPFFLRTTLLPPRTGRPAPAPRSSTPPTSRWKAKTMMPPVQHWMLP